MQQFVSYLERHFIGKFHHGLGVAYSKINDVIGIPKVSALSQKATFQGCLHKVHLLSRPLCMPTPLVEV